MVCLCRIVSQTVMLYNPFFTSYLVFFVQDVIDFNLTCWFCFIIKLHNDFPDMCSSELLAFSYFATIGPLNSIKIIIWLSSKQVSIKVHTNLCSWVQRISVRINCLPQEHNTMTRLCLRSRPLDMECRALTVEQLGPLINPLTLKIWLLILPSGCYTYPCKLVMRIWCEIKIITSTW